MPKAGKISDELASTAAIFANVEGRSLAGQVEYWAKLGLVKGNDAAGIPLSPLFEKIYTARHDMDEKLRSKTAELERSRQALQFLLEDVNEAKKELETKIGEIEQMNKLFVGRELRMVELKERIKELKDKLNGLGGENRGAAPY
jgi:peptidoglycan hydrolase CwlO-like protein